MFKERQDCKTTLKLQHGKTNQNPLENASIEQAMNQHEPTWTHQNPLHLVTWLPSFRDSGHGPLATLQLQCPGALRADLCTLRSTALAGDLRFEESRWLDHVGIGWLGSRGSLLDSRNWLVYSLCCTLFHLWIVSLFLFRCNMLYHRDEWNPFSTCARSDTPPYVTPSYGWDQQLGWSSTVSDTSKMERERERERKRERVRGCNTTYLFCHNGRIYRCWQCDLMFSESS